MKILGKHRFRTTFYHMVSIIFLLSTVFYVMGYLSDKTSYILTAALFVVDYIAEMYDPHPKNPGPWYSYFHRAWDFDDTGRKKYTKCTCECTC